MYVPTFLFQDTGQNYDADAFAKVDPDGFYLYWKSADKVYVCVWVSVWMHVWRLIARM